MDKHVVGRVVGVLADPQHAHGDVARLVGESVAGRIDVGYTVAGAQRRPANMGIKNIRRVENVNSGFYNIITMNFEYFKRFIFYF